TCSQDGTVAHFKYNYNNLDDAFSSGPRSLDGSNTNNGGIKRFSGKGMALNSVDCSFTDAFFVAVGDGGQVVVSDF
ncbi:UNVERIFIED_CONTAM: hypothetical protein HDU68_009547, partial [Siphonaria sp. JEL0065]